MKSTQKLTETEYAQVLKLLEPTITMNLKTGMHIIDGPDKTKAWALLNKYAEEKGLPRLPEGRSYGVDGDRNLLSPP